MHCLKQIVGMFLLTLVCEHECQGFDGVYTQSVNALQHARGIDVPRDFTSQSQSVEALLGVISQLKHSADLVRELQDRTRDTNASMACINQTWAVLNGTLHKQPWALSVIDSIGRPPPGFFLGSLWWPGSYDECKDTQVTLGEQSLQGRYCRTFTAPPPKGVLTGSRSINFGVCVPSTCSSQDTAGLLYTIASLMPSRCNDSANNTKPCHHVDFYPRCEEDSVSTDGRTVVAILIAVVIGVMVILGTILDVYIRLQTDSDRSPTAGKETANGKTNGSANGSANGSVNANDTDSETAPLVKKPRRQSRLKKVFLAFSAVSNGQKLLAVGEPAEGTIPSIHGIRFVSLLWVVLGHSYFFALPISGNPKVIRKWETRWTFQIIDNAYFAVDSFFVLSGLLLMYLSLREREKRGKINWLMFYIHRVWRLTPAYMLVLTMNIGLWKYMSDGPAWPKDEGFETDQCRDTWWLNLLYVNNIFKTEKMCMIWSWYLANDMQIYIISPLIMIAVFTSKALNAIAFVLLVTMHILTNSLLTYHYNLGTGSITDPNILKFMKYIYYKPYTRVGPYAIGMVTGFLLYKCKEKYRLNRLVCVSGWAIAGGLAAASLYGLSDSFKGHQLSLEMRTVYNGLSRISWGLSVAWAIFACATGNGGIINRALSWKVLVPFSRLTYCAYLVHPMVMYINYYSRRTPLYLTDVTMAYQFVGNLMLSFALAFITSLCFESPMMGLERALWRK